MNTNSSPSSSLDESDARLVAASREFMAELEQGDRPDREAYHQRYPEVAQHLNDIFDGIELAQRLRPPTSEPAEHLAAPLGDFRIVREIGRGGMGTVYEAIQLSLGRRVALKVLPFAAAMDSRHRQRFQTEAQAAAQLHHTHIVPVYAVGCERGMHFYAMQLIEGQTLAELIDEWREARSDRLPTAEHSTLKAVLESTQATQSANKSRRPREIQEGFRTSARLIAVVADALEYAHESGVIHRDIKPANLLLDHKGNIWVTDFGLAHVAADVSLTQTGDLIGTLRYMSPEQASGRRSVVDQRTDIYSLGATLYEMLTLQHVFAGTDRQHLLQQILNDDPPSPRAFNRAIPVELETIVLKCLAKAPEERYLSADDLAADLRRFLELRPILARRPTWLDTARKWLRRHPALVIACLIVLLGSVIALGITTAIVAREQLLTQSALERESQRAQEAESRFQLARRATDELIRVAEDELSDAPFEDGPRQRLLNSSLKYYRELIQLRSGGPETQAELEETHQRVTKVLVDLQIQQSGRRFMLLREPAVLADLQATPEQRTALARLVEEMDTEFDQLNDASITRRQRLEGRLYWFRTAETELAQTLTAEQRQRLPQIELQRHGLMALNDWDVAETLNLSLEQRQQLRDLEDQFRRRSRGGEPGPPGSRSTEEKLRAMAVAVAILTPAQQAQWQAMIGRPFTGPHPRPERRETLPHPVESQ